jgi:hypothetical protein
MLRRAAARKRNVAVAFDQLESDHPRRLFLGRYVIWQRLSFSLLERAFHQQSSARERLVEGLINLDPLVEFLRERPRIHRLVEGLTSVFLVVKQIACSLWLSRKSRDGHEVDRRAIRVFHGDAAAVLRDHAVVAAVRIAIDGFEKKSQYNAWRRV